MPNKDHNDNEDSSVLGYDVVSIGKYLTGVSEETPASIFRLQVVKEKWSELLGS